MRMPVRFALIWMMTVWACHAADVPRYAGAQTCSKCHRDIAATQAATAMANSWRSASSAPGTERTSNYEVRRSANRIDLSVATPSGQKAVLPVEAMVGGGRHGISFLARVAQLDGIALERPALVESRYALDPQGTLILSAGFSRDNPATYEDSLGRVLSPTFEKRCLTCHGQPQTLGAGQQGGVRCESCHGPSLNHSSLLVKAENISAASMTVCAQCHTGLSSTTHSDPLPQDLLVSNQVPALRNSECFIQSRGDLNCTECHNPHNDAAPVAEKSAATCLSCHSIAKPQHAAICPINRASDCVNCHMPSIEQNAFKLTDHWIRVHPEQGIKAAKPDETLRSQVAPVREFLRVIVVDNQEKAAAVRERLAKGDTFGAVAHDLSVDPTAPGGGYIGDMELSEMDPKLAAAAAQLSYGATSGLIPQANGGILLHRLDRDFKYDANRLFDQAVALKEHGDLAGAIKKVQQALDVYPYFLRALIFMGTTLGEAGDAQRASEVLSFAVQFYPKDSAAQFNLALTLGKHPAEQIEAFRRAIDLDPDMVAAYQSLGAALHSAGQAQAAIDVFHRGLQIDPLSAILYYDLGLALKQQGDEAGSAKALKLASKLDPEIAGRKSSSKAIQ